MFSNELRSEHRGNDDLLTAGLGLAGLRNMAPPAFADAAAPTVEELRRRALWGSWRGIADLAPGGGYGDVFGSLGPVPGREYSAYARLPGAKQPHRVLAQVPDNFDTGKRCVLVAPASGSRGIYGAVSVAAAWGLPKGCAVVYTDKGAGSDYYDLDAQMGVRANGTLGKLGEAADLAFVPDAPVNASGVAFKHAHSQDNPEADWGRHVKQAAEFALLALEQAYPRAAPFTFDNTRVIAVGISNGGGAVLRAAELDGDWDEVQLVTHSAGTILGMSLLRRILALRGGALPDHFVMVGMGLIALAGIVVNNNIILIDTYNLLRRQGLPAAQAALETGCLRLRPVLLTAVTTILGLVPMVLGVNVDLLSPSLGFGAPSTQWWTQLSSAIAGGLAFATLLTLLLTPCLLVLGARFERRPANSAVPDED